MALEEERIEVIISLFLLQEAILADPPQLIGYCISYNLELSTSYFISQNLPQPNLSVASAEFNSPARYKRYL